MSHSVPIGGTLSSSGASRAMRLRLFEAFMTNNLRRESGSVENFFISFAPNPLKSLDSEK
jgi:hypothetical protein